jgi:osmotically-inducible protein OsmY
MKRIVRRAPSPWAAVLVLLGAWTAVAATPPDAWITMKAKLALLTSERVGASSVDVDTTDGQVTLHGKVASDAEKSEAERVARGVDGVRGVRNMLQVVSPARSEAARVADDDLRERVEAALEEDESLRDSDIDVASVNDGVVLLEGDARTIGDHVRAVETVARTPGVRRVASQIESPDRLADAEIYRERGEDDGGVADAVRDRATDAWVTSATKMKLLADDRVPGLDVNVDTRAGEVTLFGIVPTQEAKRAAEEVARGVSGVRAVRNELQVVAERRQEAVRAADDEIAERVESAIERNESLRDADIDVAVENGVARLTGTVPRPEQRMTAAVVARQAAGVRAVREELRVEN